MFSRASSKLKMNFGLGLGQDLALANPTCGYRLGFPSFIDLNIKVVDI